MTLGSLDYSLRDETVDQRSRAGGSTQNRSRSATSLSVRLGVVALLILVEVRQGDAGQLLDGSTAGDLVASAGYRLEGLGEHELEVGELGVDVVVDLALDAFCLGLGGGDDAPGLAFGLCQHLGLRNESHLLVVCSGDDLVALAVGGGDHAFGIGQQAVRPRQVGRQLTADDIEARQKVFAVDHARGRHRHRPRALEHLTQLVELVVDLHVTSWGSIGARPGRDGTCGRIALGSRR